MTSRLRHREQAGNRPEHFSFRSRQGMHALKTRRLSSSSKLSLVSEDEATKEHPKRSLLQFPQPLESPSHRT